MSAIVHETNDQGNHAADRAAARLSPATVEQAKSIAVGHQEIDPELAASVDQNGWIYHFRRRAEEAEKMVEVQTAARNAAEANYEALATAFSGEQQRAQEIREDYEYTLEVIAEMNQGCSWLAEALQATESCWNLAEHECTEVVGGLAVEQNRHDTTKRLLADSETQRDYYRDQFDITRRSLLDWQTEADRAQREVISQAETILNLADVILAVAACDQTNGFENPVIKMPAELYQRLMRVAAALGVK